MADTPAKAKDIRWADEALPQPAQRSKSVAGQSLSEAGRSDANWAARFPSSAATSFPQRSHSATAAQPERKQFSAPTREQKSLIVADTCGLMSMDKVQLQRLANHLRRAGEVLAIPSVVLNELDGIQKDKKKVKTKEERDLARQVQIWIEELQVANYIRIQKGKAEADADIYCRKNDDEILAYAVYLHKQEEAKASAERRQVKLLSDDRNLRMKARGYDLGISLPTDF